MKTRVFMINHDTNGMQPIECEIVNCGNNIQLQCGGLRGISIQIPVDVIADIISDNLHG